MSVNLATGYTRTTAEPVDVLYLTNTLTSYASTSAANTAIISSVRYIGQFVNINNQLYWYKNGITDGDLILFNQETTPLTTKGDIYVRNASTDTRLPVGTDTQILIADSTTATGLKWGNNISLTTTGTSGAATLISNVLNIPNYTLAGLGGQPLATNLTSLAGLSYGSTSFVKMTAAGTFSLDTATYLTAESDTLATVTSRGASTSTQVTFSGAGNNTTTYSSVRFSGYNQGGGIGYHGVFELENTYGSVTNGKKFFRLDSAGTIQIINSAYTTNIFNLTDAGALTVSSIIKSGGTSAQILAADGSVITAGFGITISGGTISASGTAGVTTLSFGSTGLTPSSATSGAITVAGTLVAANGGTGQSSYTIGDILYASTTTALSKLASVAAGSYLRSAGTGTAPVWSTTTIPNTAVLGDIWYGSASNTVSALTGNTTSTRKFLRQTGTGTVSAAPVWDTLLASDITGSALTKTDDTNVTLTLGGSASTALLNAASITVGWSGQLAVSRGGTGAGTLTGVVIGNGTSAMTAVSSVTANQLFRVNATGTGYEFFTPAYLTSAITSLNGLTGSTQTFGNDTNVTIVSSGTAHTITWSGTLANTRLATMANNTIKGNISGSTASPSDLTGTQVTTILDTFTSSLKGLTPASGGGTTNFLRADGTWTVPSGSGIIKNGTASGTGGYVSTISGVTAYTDGDAYIIKFTNTNNGTPSTLNINSLGAIQICTDDIGTLIPQYQIVSNAECLLIYNSSLNKFKIHASGNYLSIKDSSFGGLNRSYGNARIGTNDSSADKTLTITVYNEDAIKITTDVSQGPTNIDIAPGYTAGFTSTNFQYNGQNFLNLLGTNTGFSPTISMFGSNGTNNSFFAMNAGITLSASADIIVETSGPYSIDLSASKIRYVDSSSGYYVGFQLPSLSTSSTYTLPTSIPTSNKILQSDSSGVLTWVTASAGTVTSVAALTLGTSGTDLSSTVANGTTTPVITLNVPDASATARGALTSTDWSTFNSKQAALVGTGFVKSTAGTISYDTNTYLTGNQTITLGGDLSGSGTTSITASIGANKVTNAMLAQAAANSILGNNTGSPANVAYLTGTEVTAMLDVFTSTLKGLAPASGGGTTKFLRADGNWAAPYTFSTGLTESAGTVTANLSTGVAGGQTVIGGTAASNNLTLSSTSNATKGKIILGTLSAYDEVNDRLGIGSLNPGSKVTVVNGSTATVGLSVSTTATSNQAAVFNATNSSTAANVTACVYTVMTLNPTASAAASNRALYMSVQLNSSNDSAFTANPSAGFFECRVLRAGAITDLTGGTFFGVFIPSSGVTGTINITRTTGINVQAAYSGQPGLTGTIANARGIYVSQSNVSASSVVVTSQVGITMDNLTSATNNTAILLGTTTIPSGNWAIFATTTNSSYLAGSLGLGTTPSYKLDVNGTGRFSSALTTTGRIQAYSRKTSNYTLINTDRVIAGDAGTAAITLTLPAHVAGTEYTIVKSDSTANKVTIATTSGTISGVATYDLTAQYMFITVISDGSNWFIVAAG